VPFIGLAFGLGGRIFHGEAMVFHEFEKVEGAENADDFLFVGDDEMVDAMITHDASGDIDVVIPGDGVDLGVHDGGQGRIRRDVAGEVVGGDDADGFIGVVDDGKAVDAPAGDAFFEGGDGVIGFDHDDGRDHEVIYFCVHGEGF
jgi:hypothetical protein